MKSKGFTLIEVVMALALLSFLGVLTSQSISQAIRSKKKIQEITNQSGLLRDVLQVIQKDINKAFHYYDINVDIYNESQKERIKRCKQSTQTRPVNQDAVKYCQTVQKNFKQKKQKNLTQFQGESDNLHFTSLNYTRNRKNLKFSRQSEVGYFLRTCKGRFDKTTSSQCLWRRISPIIDDKVDEGGEEMVLLEDVSEIEFRYLGPEKEEGDEWIDTWKTGENADDVTRNKFPSAVEITVTLKKKKIRLSTVANIRFPNNLRRKF